jgi:cytochrome c oxidase cbb3-type subunit III
MTRVQRVIGAGVGVMIGAWLSALAFAQAQAQGQQPAPASQQAPAGQGGAPRRPSSDSPASVRRPTTTAQTYSAAQIEEGKTRFGAQCGFCHGRDATGGESGPDLTRSALVAEDVRGNKIAPMVRAGRADKGMPPFTLSDTDMNAIVAFIHDATVKATSLGGGRRSVEVADLQTGSADAGKTYFNGPGGCVTCHGPTTNFATVGSRYQGLALLQRMLYPGSGGRGSGPPPAPPTLTVTTANGQAVTGQLAYRDEFTITLMDADGWTRSWPVKAVRITGDEPLRAHIDQLAKYTDKDMHDVFAYLQTLR